MALSAACVFFVETLDPSFGIDQFGITGVEGMAVSTGIYMHFCAGGTGFGYCAAGAMNFGVNIFGVKISFHDVLLEIG